MEIKAIRTEADYLAALREVSALIDLDPQAERGTAYSC
jgi:HTH-type transcriptional regulator/antitoxin HigA